MSMGSTQMGCMLETAISSWKDSMSTSMRRREDDMYQGRSLWTSSQAQWILSGLVLMDTFTGQIITYSASRVPETTGRKVITPKEQNLLTLCSMSPENRLRDVTVYRVCKSSILLVVELDLVWAPSLSPNCAKNTPTE